MPKKIELVKQAPVMPSEHDGDICLNIADFLEQLLLSSGITDGNRLELPSLSDLAEFLDTRQMTVHNAFQILRKRGYDYAIQGLSTPLVFWKQQSVLPERLPEIGSNYQA